MRTCFDGQVEVVCKCILLLQLKAIKRDFDTMADKVSPEVQDVYNAKQYLEDLYKAVCGSSNSTYPGLKPVIDAMEDAVVSTHPKYRYLIGGSNSFYDVYCVCISFYNLNIPLRWVIKSAIRL